jgi:hypothetical protein
VAEGQATVVTNVDLRSLPAPSEDEMPYRQYLLSQEPMLVLPNDNPQNRDVFFDGLHERVKGVPSKLEARWENAGVSSWVDAFVKLKFLLNADDEQILAQMPQGK